MLFAGSEVRIVKNCDRGLAGISNSTAFSTLVSVPRADELDTVY